MYLYMYTYLSVCIIYIYIYIISIIFTQERKDAEPELAAPALAAPKKAPGERTCLTLLVLCYIFV